MHLSRLALGIAATLAACRTTPAELTDCAGAIGGVWIDDTGRRWHVWEDEGAVEVFPMWDTSVPDGGAKTPLPAVDPDAPVLSPLRIHLATRSPAEISGEASRRITRAGRTCLVRAGARLSACRGHAAVLSLERRAPGDPATCEPGASEGWIAVNLRRE